MGLFSRKEWLVVLVASIALVALGLFISTDHHIRGEGVYFNYEYEDQLIVEKYGGGSLIPDEGMIFSVVSFNIDNNTRETKTYMWDQVVLSVDGVEYKPYILAENLDGSWEIGSYVDHSGVNTYMIPENHGDCILKISGWDLILDEELSLMEIPYRAEGQLYGKITYELRKDTSSDVVYADVVMENISYENGLTPQPEHFNLSGVNSMLDYAGALHLILNPPTATIGNSIEFTLEFEIYFDEEYTLENISLDWTGSPERGMEIIRI